MGKALFWRGLTTGESRIDEVVTPRCSFDRLHSLQCCHPRALGPKDSPYVEQAL